MKEILHDDADYNAVTVVMTNNKTDLPGAIQWISDRHDDVVDNFMRVRDDVLNKKNGFPSYGEDLDRQIALYVDGLGLFFILPRNSRPDYVFTSGQWIRGHDEWNFGSGRYFGDKGLDIQKSRLVVIA